VKNEEKERRGEEKEVEGGENVADLQAVDMYLNTEKGTDTTSPKEQIF
jgi:hypothetical protein